MPASVIDLFRTPPAPTATNLDVALASAAAGFPVFPCRPSVEGEFTAKSPRVAGSHRAGTTDEAAIQAWWTRWPDSLVGLGLAEAGVMAIDADRHGGPDGVAAWEALATANGFDFAAYPTVNTPGNGRHFYMRRPAGTEPTNGEGDLPDGINVRGAGYTIAPGCVLPDGRCYEPVPGAPPLSRDIPEAPAWLLATIGTRRRSHDNSSPACELDVPAARERAAAYLSHDAAPAIEGQGGDNTAYRVACQVKDFGISESECLSLLLEHYQPRCISSCGGEDEAAWLERKVASAYANGQNAPGVASPAVDLAGVEVIAPRYVERPARRSALRFLSDPDAATQPHFLMRPDLPEVGVATIAGQSRAGKSFAALYLSTALSTGSEFFGRTARERVGVLFVAAEAPGTIGPRLEAIRRHQLGGLDPDLLAIAWTDLDDVARPPDMAARVAAVVAGIEEQAQEAAAVMLQRFGLRLGAIFIDTVGAAFGVADNDDEAAKLVMTALSALSRRNGALVIPVAHYGKDDRSGIAGSYYWTASADVVLSITANICERTGEVSDRRIAVSKNKLDEQGPISGFKLDRVDLGLDRDGKEVTSAIVRATADKVKPERPSPHADTYRECLFNALVEKSVEIDGRPAAERRAVLAQFRERKPGSKDSGNVSRAFASAERWAGVTVIHREGVDYVVEDQWPTTPQA